MVVHFGSEICGDLRVAEQREWLVTNGLGGYAMGTVSGAPSRSYHGLLIAALSPPVERTLLVSQLEASVSAPDGSTTALGHRQIESFALEGTVPRWRYAVADALLEKRVWMAQGANTTYVSYRLVARRPPGTHAGGLGAAPPPPRRRAAGAGSGAAGAGPAGATPERGAVCPGQ